MSKPLIEIDRLVKRFGAVRAVDDVSFQIDEARILRAARAVGLRQDHADAPCRRLRYPDAGRILIDGRGHGGRAAASAACEHDVPVLRAVSAHERRKEHRLRPARQGMATGAIAERVREMLALVQTGGVRRAAARSIVRRAEAARRAGPRACRASASPACSMSRSRRSIASCARKRSSNSCRCSAISSIAFLVVTHDQDEAMAMAQRIALMREGRIEQIGAARDVYEQAGVHVGGQLHGRCESHPCAGARGSRRWRGAACVRRTILDVCGARHVAQRDRGRRRACAAGWRALTLAIRAERIALRAERPSDVNNRSGGRGRRLRLSGRRDDVARVMRAGDHASRLADERGSGELRARRAGVRFLAGRRGAQPAVLAMLVGDMSVRGIVICLRR